MNGKRFDLKHVLLLFFLFQRGLGTGLTIYAPAIILSAILGWNLTYMNIVIGVLVIIYTFSGGTKAVNVTQKTANVCDYVGDVYNLFLDFVSYNDMTFTNALHIAGANDKMKIVSFSTDPEDKYTIWSGYNWWFLLSASLFWNRSISSRAIFIRKVCARKSDGLDHERTKSTMQFYFFIDWSNGFVFFQFNPVPLNFNP
jgi:Na+/proline symporter